MLDVVGKYAIKWRFRLDSENSKPVVGGKCGGGEWKINEENEECGSFLVSLGVV